jgi:hypothetical protein
MRFCYVDSSEQTNYGLLKAASVLSMSSFIYPTDLQILDGLRECFDLIQHMAEIEAPLYPAPPNEKQLMELLESCYAASLETEEGRTIAFTVDFFGEDEPRFDYQLKQTLPLSTRDLSRLAVALDPWRSRICVMPGGTGLQIVSVIHLGEQFAFHGTRLTLRQLSIRVLAPGVLVVRYGGVLLLTYQRGRFAFHCGPSARWGQFAVRTALAFHSHSGQTIEQLQADLRFEAALIRMARAMLYQRHGGTLLILPHDTDWENSAFSKRYAPAGPVSVVKDANVKDMEYAIRRNELFQQVIQGQSSPEVASVWADDIVRARFVSELEWLARLTLADGMTVIERDLTLLGFGIFFDAQDKPDSPTRVVLIDPYDDGSDSEPKTLASIGGARHQSAAVTCRRFPGAVAVVASQDGSLSSMKWDATKNVVIAFHHLELLLEF